MSAYGDTVAVCLNLLLVAEFLFHRKSAAVLDVAGEHLAVDEVTFNTGVAGWEHRLALTALLYWKDPQLLVALDRWDRWHSRRRCVLAIDGHLRANLALGAVSWSDHVAATLATLDPKDRVELRGVLRRRCTSGRGRA